MSFLQRLAARISVGPAESPDDSNALAVAAAVLLLEVEHADFDHRDVERASVESALASMFDLEGDDLQALVAKAGLASAELVSLHAVVEAINRQMDYAERVDLLSLMWRVAFADGELHPNEEHAIRRIADLLHVRHADFIRTRLAVEPGSA